MLLILLCFVLVMPLGNDRYQRLLRPPAMRGGFGAASIDAVAVPTDNASHRVLLEKDPSYGQPFDSPETAFLIYFHGERREGIWAATTHITYAFIEIASPDPAPKASALRAALVDRLEQHGEMVPRPDQLITSGRSAVVDHLWFGYGQNLLAACTLLLGVAKVFITVRDAAAARVRAARRRRSQCVACGYDMSRSGTVCPECGTGN